MSALASRSHQARNRRRPARRLPRASPPALLSAAGAVAALARERTPREEAIDELAAMVVEVTGTPIDSKGVAATLESRGLRDLDAIERYGYRDIFGLAEEVFARARAKEPGQPTWATPSRAPVASRRELALAFGRGIFSYLPLLFQIVLLVAVGNSQWGWLHFSLAQASTVALGVGLAMITTAPFHPVLGYLGLANAESDKHVLAAKATSRIIAAGLLTSALVSAAVCGLLLLTGAYPAQRLGQALVYALLIALLWLANGALWMVKRQLWILVSITLSVGIGAEVLHATSWGIYAAHWLGLAAAIALELCVVAQLLRRRIAGMPDELRLARFPRPAVLRRRIAPLAAYGLANAVMVLSDRALAWTAGHHPLPLWFNVRYELGLDAAMAAALLGTALLEPSLHAFSRIAIPRQDRFSGLAVADHNRWYLRFLARQLAAVLALLILGAAAVVALIVLLHDVHALGKTARFYYDPVTRRVFVMGTAAYALMALGRANTGLLLNLSRRREALTAVVAGAVMAMIAGLALSRAIGFYFAAAGLVAGTAVFAALAGFYAARVLRRADYHLFAAY